MTTQLRRHRHIIMVQLSGQSLEKLLKVSGIIETLLIRHQDIKIALLLACDNVSFEFLGFRSQLLLDLSICVLGIVNVLKVRFNDTGGHTLQITATNRL